MPDSPVKGGDEFATDGFFAPRADEKPRHGPDRRRLTWPRLLLRVAVAALALLGADALAAKTVTPDTVFEDAYRLPAALPTADIARFAHSIHAASLSPGGPPIVVFLGASPTWGHRIADPRNTFPAAFESAARRGGWPNTAYNLASNGQFVSDQYFIAKRVAPDSDVVFVQLTYHTFSAAAREGLAMRYPELPALLEVDVSPSEAVLAGVEPFSTDDASSRASEVLGSRWLLWRERDALNRALFGGTPQALLAREAASEDTSLTSLPDDAAQDGFASFEDLDPERRFIAIDRYAADSSFDIDSNDSEMRFLRKLVALLASHDKKAVFFMAPLNRTLIEEYELIDPEQYRANTDSIRSAVAEGGFLFLDFNTGPSRLGPDRFADISHTTDEGGRETGSLLFEEARDYLEGRP